MESWGSSRTSCVAKSALQKTLCAYLVLLQRLKDYKLTYLPKEGKNKKEKKERKKGRKKESIK